MPGFVDKFREKIKKQENLSIENRIENTSYIVSSKVQEERMQICKSCEHLFHATNSCKKCGCFMILKTKLKNAQCPINKW